MPPNLQDETTHTWAAIPPTVQPHALTEQVAQPPAIALVDDILQTSMTVHCPANARLTTVSSGRNLVILDDVLNSEAVRFHTPAIVIPAEKGYALHLFDRHTPTIFPTGLNNDRPTLLQLFIRGNPFRGSAGLPDVAEDWIHHLLHTQQLRALAIYGSPYLLERLLPHLLPNLPYVFTYGQMPQAQTIALRKLFE